MASTLGQLLEFRLGTEAYCIDIAYVDEIVGINEIRSLPQAPRHVEGVTDLRGQTTTVIDPSVALDVETDIDWTHILVLDTTALGNGDESLGWLVNDVNRETDIEETEIERTTTTDGTAVDGLVTRDNEYLVQLDPTAVAA